MIINIQINKDLEVKVEIDNELIEQKKEKPKGEFLIQKKGAGDKAKEDLEKQAKDYIDKL